MAAPFDPVKFGKVAAMLSSEHDGEILAAVRRMSEMLKASGLSFLDLRVKGHGDGASAGNGAGGPGPWWDETVRKAGEAQRQREAAEAAERARAAKATQEAYEATARQRQEEAAKARAAYDEAVRARQHQQQTSHGLDWRVSRAGKWWAKGSGGSFHIFQMKSGRYGAMFRYDGANGEPNWGPRSGFYDEENAMRWVDEHADDLEDGYDFN